MKALVTGAAGFIGAHVTAALAAAGAEVRAYDLQPLDPVPPDVEPVVGDVVDRDAVVKALDGCDAVFHLAAVYSYRRADADLMRRVNVYGSGTVLDAVARQRRRVRVVYTSSCATCGPVPGRAATEADQPPDWELSIPYKYTKLAGEALALRAASEGQDVVVVNPTTPVGPGDRRPTPTGKMVRDVISGHARAYLAKRALNVVAVEDVAHGHLLAHESGRPGERYLLGGENVDMRDVFGVLAQAAGVSAPRIALPWGAVNFAAHGAYALSRPFRREPSLLVLDEVRLARFPMAYDDAKARRELGYRSRPAREALTAAALAAANSSNDGGAQKR